MIKWLCGFYNKVAKMMRKKIARATRLCKYQTERWVQSNLLIFHKDVLRSDKDIFILLKIFNPMAIVKNSQYHLFAAKCKKMIHKILSKR